MPKADPSVRRPVKVGGQALPDGVMMRTDRAWAVARADGSIRSGPVRRVPFARVPILRVVTGLAQALRLGLVTAAGGWRKRGPGWPLIRALVLTEAAAIAFTWVAAVAHLPLGGHWTSSLATWAVAIAVFKATSPPAQWRYHGAEHKAVSAYEQAVPLSDVVAVMACSRVHPRCGTNLIVWLAVATPLVERLPWTAQPVAFVVLLGTVAEALALAGRRPANVAARVVLAPGRFLQSWLTTREPTSDEQRVGCQALTACLALHQEITSEDTGRPEPARSAPDALVGAGAMPS